MNEKRFQGSEILFDSDEVRLTRSGHPEHVAGVWCLEVFGDLGRRAVADTDDAAVAAEWLASLKAGEIPEADFEPR